MQRSSIISTCSAVMVGIDDGISDGVVDGIDEGISDGVTDGTTMLESGTRSEEAGAGTEAVTGIVYTSAVYLSYNTFDF